MEFLILEIQRGTRNDLDEGLSESEHLLESRELTITSPSGTKFSHTITGSDFEGLFHDGTGDFKVLKNFSESIFWRG